ncbi:MAG: lactate permease [Chloroflexi bacterium]|nr:MAG: lactate permease [Chloroflexota bacterium]
MNLPGLTVLNVFMAASPIFVVLYLMIGRNWGGSKAGSVGWLTAVLVSLFFFGTNLQLLLVSTGRALLLALYVLYIIWMALLLYHTVNDAGAITVIGQQVPRLAHDKPAQTLLLAWVFGSFLQGATGFGVPAAIVAPLLVGLGFEANTAVTMALLGHAWAVTYGSLGSSFLSLMAATTVPGEILASPVAIMLGICCVLCGMVVLWLSGKGTAVRQRWLFLLALALIMSVTQWGMAQLGLWTLAAFGAGLAGLVVSIIYFTKLQNNSHDRPQFNTRRFLQAFFPYAILIVVTILGQIFYKTQLSFVQFNITFPAVATSFGWVTEAGTGRSLNLFGHAGALLLYTTILAFLWFKWRGPIHFAEKGGTYNGRAIIQKTRQGSQKPTIAIFTLVAMAVTMTHAGMTQLLAQALSAVSGPIYPFISPFIGALGALMTGSNTNSNVVFGGLQETTAVALAVSVPLILAAQTAGGAIGSTFAPAKVIVGCSTVSGADNGKTLRLATIYGVSILIMLGLITTLLLWLLS